MTTPRIGELKAELTGRLYRSPTNSWAGYRSNPMNLEDGEAEIGYWVRSAARGQGVAVNAVDLLASWSFSVGFHRLIIHHSTTNPASCSVARKAGFDLEGTKKSALLHADGWHDMHLHARINPG
jgi:ribosomal-protein-alanine N-acetyltransferase